LPATIYATSLAPALHAGPFRFFQRKRKKCTTPIIGIVIPKQSAKEIFEKSVAPAALFLHLRAVSKPESVPFQHNLSATLPGIEPHEDSCPAASSICPIIR
jgi:hypothetical protein